MAGTFHALNIREFEELLDAWTPRRRIDTVHIHCTDQPRHANFRGVASMEAMRLAHLGRGMVDIAQHLTIAPDGVLWTGRPFDMIPASVRGHNGTAAAGPFMIEIVGLFEKRGDVAADPFQGDQERATLAAVCAVLRKFGLDETAIRYHCEFPNVAKTCPGKGFNRAKFLADVREQLARGTLAAFDVEVPRALRSERSDREALLRGEPAGVEPADGQVPEDAAVLDEHEVLARWLERGLIEPAGRATRGGGPQWQALVPHVVNTSQGVLSRRGEFSTSREELRELVEVHLDQAVREGRVQHIMFHAHGGLNSERDGLGYASTMIPWWLSHGVYPIYFAWESGLFETIRQQRRALGEEARGRGIGDFFDAITEELTRSLAGPIWQAMKDNARNCSAPMTGYGEPGGLHEFWKVLGPWLAANRDRVSLHAVGHSTGPILLSRFLPLLLGDPGNHIASLHYLAPAIRVDDFLHEVAGRVGPGKGIERLCIYTMRDRAERDDNVAGIYRKSLLYYVRQACEGRPAPPILGLEKDLRADAALRNLFNLPQMGEVMSAVGPRAGGRWARIEFSQPPRVPQNPRTRAHKHGCFDNDEATMSSVLCDILGVGTLVGRPGGARFPTPPKECRDDGTRAFDPVQAQFDERFDDAGGCCCRCCCRRGDDGDGFGEPSGPGNDSGGGGAGWDADDPDGDFEAGMGGDRPAPSPGGGGAGVGSRRRAVCVGIDAYPRQPLEGCVADSENWARALAAAGFEVTKLQDRKAIRAALDRALRDLVSGARAGDQLVFQYAGHGSQVEDLSGDDEDGWDEVMVPVDFDRGELWLDDDVHAASGLLPAGATLTFITDCCHSGTNTRFALGMRSVAAAGRGARPRYLKLSAADVDAFRKKWRASRAAAPVSERAPVPGVVHFAACEDREVAYEEDGQGNFSRHALTVIGAVLARRGSNADFHGAIVKAFGNDGRQHPVMDAVVPAALADAPLFGGQGG